MNKITIDKKEFKKLYDIACEGWKPKFDEMFKKQVFSDTLEFEENFIQEMKNACTEEQLSIFMKIFKNFLPETKLYVTKYSEVCKKLGEVEITKENFINLPASTNIRKLIGEARVDQLMRYFNGKDWKPNYNENQKNWFPYFRKVVSGWVFVSSGYDDDSSSFAWAGVYETQETSDFVGKTFLEEIYSDLLD